jgi:hypothetical protein
MFPGMPAPDNFSWLRLIIMCWFWGIHFFTEYALLLFSESRLLDKSDFFQIFPNSRRLWCSCC